MDYHAVFVLQAELRFLKLAKKFCNERAWWLTCYILFTEIDLHRYLPNSGGHHFDCYSGEHPDVKSKEYLMAIK